MSAIIARLIASIVLMLSMPVLYGLLAFVSFEILAFRDDTLVLTLITVICAATAMLAWVALWYSQVRWTPNRIISTFALLLGITFGAAIIGGMIAAAVRYNGNIGLVFASMLWGLGWFGLTPLMWKETRAERNARLQQISGDKGLACPVCNYNLTGLREAKCPECGASYTLDQLYAAITESREPIEQR